MSTQSPRRKRSPLNRPREWRVFGFERSRSGDKNVEAIEVLAPNAEAALTATSIDEVDQIPGLKVRQKKFSQSDAVFRRFFCRKKPRRKEITTFITDMARVLGAGIRFSDGLLFCAETAKTPVFKGLLGAFHNLISKKGQSVGDSMAEFQFAFPPELIAVVRASEVSGQTAAVFKMLGVRRRKLDKIISKIVGALVYPLFMGVGVGGIAIMIIYFVIPKLLANFADQRLDLPKGLQVAIDILQFLTGSPIGIAVPVSVLLLLFFLRKKILGSLRFQRTSLKVPMLGTLFSKFFFVRSLSTLAMMWKSGVKMEKSFELSGESAGCKLFQQYYTNIYGHIKKGASIPSAFIYEKDLIGKDAIALAYRLRLAQESGRTTDILEEMVDDMEEELDMIVEQLPKWLESLVMGVLMFVVMSLGMLIMLMQLTFAYMLTK
jgi:type IV pilus assembly protein PilC